MKNLKYIIISIFFLVSIYSLNVYGQGGDNAAAASGAPIVLPFSANGTTVGRVDNYNNINIFDVGFTSGPDWLYYFCATSDNLVSYNLTFTPDAVNGVWPSFSVWQGGIPGVGTLIAQDADQGTTNSSMTGEFIIQTGQCYYVMIDNWPTPDGFPYNLSLTVPPASPVLPVQPSCSNIGFDNGSFGSWTGGYSYTVTTNLDGASTPLFIPDTYNTTTVQHAITSGAATDPIAGFPQVCPGQGPNSARIGSIDNIAPDNLYPNRGGARLEQKFAVTNSNALFTYYYAVVIQNALAPIILQNAAGGDSLDALGNPVYLQNWNNTADSLGPHKATQQPFFKVELFDNNDLPLSCGNYLVVGGPGVPGFTLVPGSTDLYYRDWTPAFIDLTPYIGSNVKVRFTTADCSLGGHFCYAYVDGLCQPLVVNNPVSICPGNSTTLTSSLTGASYSWYETSNPGNILGTNQTLSVSPLVNTQYTCVVTAPSGCSTTLTFNVNLYPASTVTSTSQTICAGGSTTLVATGSSAPSGTYSWSPAGGTNATTSSLSPASTTTYTVTYTDPNGCVSTGTGAVSVNPLPTAPPTTPVSYCQNATPNDLANSVTASAGCTLNWYGTNSVGGTASGTPPTVSTASVGTITYYVSQTNTTTGCEGPRASIVVTINALPNVTVTSPSTCPGIPVNITASGANTYSWSTSETGATISFTTNAATTVTVTGTNTVTGCTNSAISNVSVNGNITLTANDTTICEGGTATLTANGATNYSWSTGATTQTISVSPVTTTTYTVDGNTAGCTGSTTVTVTVNPVPTVTVNSDVICDGTTINVIASPSLPGGSYVWTPNIGSAQSNSITPSTTTTYNVVYTLNGCSNTGSGTITVNPTPTVAVVPQTICLGDQATLTATTNPGGGTYSWNPTNQTTNSISVTPIATGNSNYTVTYDLNGCIATATGVVTTNPVPTVTVNSSTICNGAVATVTASPNLPGGSYSWTPNIGTIASNSVNPNTTTSYSVVYTLNGCPANGSGTVTVNPTPTVTVDNDVICLGEQATLTATANPGGGTYLWTPTNFTTSVINISPAASGTYSVTYTLNGCSATGSGNITVNPLPNVNAGVDQLICIGNQVTLTASGANTYSWDNNVVNGVSFSPVQTNTYTVTGTSAAGCVNTDQVVVTVEPLPVVSFYPSDTFGCTPMEVTLYNTTPNVTDCIWTLSDGTTLSGCTSVQTIFSQAGCYDITLTTSSANGCTNTASVQNMICVEQSPIANFAADPNELTTISTTSQMFNSSVNASTYFWTFGDGGSSNLENPSHVFPSEEGEYLITLFAYSPSGNCYDTTTQTIKIEEETIIYVPNTFTPDDDIYNQEFKPVFTSGFDPQSYTLFIFNRYGELIFESHNVNIGWKGTYGSDKILVQDDTYVWKIIYKKKNDNNKNVIVGHVNVLK